MSANVGHDSTDEMERLGRTVSTLPRNFELLRLRHEIQAHTSALTSNIQEQRVKLTQLYAQQQSEAKRAEELERETELLRMRAQDINRLAANAAMGRSKPVKNKRIQVLDPITVGSWIAPYTRYTVVVWDDQTNEKISTVYRRFRDFEWLYEKLWMSTGRVLLPALPDKRMMKFDQELIAERLLSLQAFLRELVLHFDFKTCYELRAFLFFSAEELCHIIETSRVKAFPVPIRQLKTKSGLNLDNMKAKYTDLAEKYQVSFQTYQRIRSKEFKYIKTLQKVGNCMELEEELDAMSCKLAALHGNTCGEETLEEMVQTQYLVLEGVGQAFKRLEVLESQEPLDGERIEYIKSALTQELVGFDQHRAPKALDKLLTSAQVEIEKASERQRMWQELRTRLLL